MDIVDTDNGYVKYFGDNKASSKTPQNPNTSNNIKMIDQYKLHSSNILEERIKSAPIIIFRQHKVSNNPKGYRKFLGFGIITNVEIVIEYDSKLKVNFPNYAFDITVLNMDHENETFDWRWISARRDKNIDINSTNKFAPKSWQLWSKNGVKTLLTETEDLSTKLILKSEDQKIKDQRHISILKSICKHYKEEKKKRILKD